VLFGHFGDKLGRKPTLVIALVLMGTATVLVGLLPGFATIGVWAPILLFVFRFCQGLAIGGQWGGAVLLATEYAPPNRRGLFGSLAQTGVPVGVIFGNLVFLAVGAVTTEAQFLAWGWRIPFLVGVLLIGVAMYIQLRLEETPAFRHLEEQQEGNETQERSPVLEVIKEHPKQILLAGGAFFVVNGSFYISSAIQIPALLGFAALTDRVGRRPVYLIGAILLGLWAFPMFWLVNTRDIVLITLALSFGQVFLSMMYGPQAALFAEMFSARVRYSGASLGYQGAAVFAGGLAPIIMVWLLETTGTSLSVSFYILAMAAITFISVYLITDTYEDEMTEDVAGESEAIARERDATTS
jgi:MFS family permease